MDASHEDESTSSGTYGRWHDGPSVKQRTAVQRLVRHLFDSLAPERPPARAGQAQAAVQLLRSPRGCILQAASRAVSVSWFATASGEAPHGELQVIEWDGVVSRPGSANRATRAAVAVSETLLWPDEGEGEAWSWRTSDGARCDTVALAARCHALLAAAPATLPVRVIG